MSAVESRRQPQVSFWNDPKARSFVFQAIAILLLLGLAYDLYYNASSNLAKLGKTFGYEFWNRSAGFDMSQSLIEYSSSSSYGRAIYSGLLNTLLVAILGIMLATVIGFMAGIARLSKNWLIATIATFYVEIVRNIPLLLQIFIWYGAVLKPLPAAKEAINFGSFYLSNRGSRDAFSGIWAAGLDGFCGLVAGVIGAIFLRRWARARQMATGQPFPYIWGGIGLITALPLLSLLIVGWPVSWDVPTLGAFNFSGGVTVYPEFIALLVALSVYTGSFIAEIVRAGIQAVSHGQTEAASALGLRASHVTRLVILPQAMRIIIPPLASQFLNLTKNSSLAVAIAYPDFVAMGGTVLNQTGKAIEIILLFMIVYLTLSLLTSGFMNWYQFPHEAGGAVDVAKSLRQSLAYVRAEDAPKLSPPANLVGWRGWVLANLFPNWQNGLLTIVASLFLYWVLSNVLGWALFRAVWTGENRDVCAVQGVGACWPFVGAKFAQWIYGFYPIDQRWRVNICFIVGLCALIPLLMPSVPYKKWNALFFLMVFPLMSFILLTGGNFSISLSSFLSFAVIFAVIAAFLPLVVLGIEEGLHQSWQGLVLAGIGFVVWLSDFFIVFKSMSTPLGELPYSVVGGFLLVFAGGAMGLAQIGRLQTPDARATMRELAHGFFEHIGRIGVAAN